MLKHVPQHIETALEIGCGTGGFSRLLAQRADHVLALDLSPQMIRIARERSADYPNIEYERANAEVRELPESAFDCIATIATMHHLPLEAMLLKMKRALKPGGVLLVLDLYQVEQWGWQDVVRNAVAMPYSFWLKLFKTGRLRPPREVREAWEEHGKIDHYLSPEQIRSACAELPGAKIRFHLLWRYSIIWKK